MKEIDIINFDENNIKDYEEEIKEMFIENTYKFHYPDKEVDLKYIDDRYNNLIKYLHEGNTYFIGAIIEDILVGFIWIYQRDFMTYKRMIINNLFVSENARSGGVGSKLIEAASDKARELGCKEISTHYASINENAGKFYKKNNFEEKRIEVVKTL